MSHRFVLRIFMGSAVLFGSTVGIVNGPSTQAAETTTTIATATVGRAARPSCGDRLYRKPGGGYWRCSFADGFDGERLNRRKWAVATTERSGFYSGEHACFVDDPANVSVSRGSLKLRVVATAPFLCRNASAPDFLTSYTAGSLTTNTLFEQAYGRYEFRVKFPASKRPGLHSALWLNPSKQVYGAWPASGEIDIAERFTAYQNRLIPYVHYLRNGAEAHDTNEECFVPDLSERFHKVVLIWTPRGMTVKYDRKTCLRARTTSDLPANKPFDIPFNLLLSQGLGVGGNQFRPGFTPLPATLEVDYVRVWR